jgi:hypothetical protein
VTNWIGDDGMLHKFSCEIRRRNLEGDTLFLHASVTGKYAGHGKKYSELAPMAENQDGELSARGKVVSQLPGRTGEAVGRMCALREERKWLGGYCSPAIERLHVDVNETGYGESRDYTACLRLPPF